MFYLLSTDPIGYEPRDKPLDEPMFVVIHLIPELIEQYLSLIEKAKKLSDEEGEFRQIKLNENKNRLAVYIPVTQELYDMFGDVSDRGESRPVTKEEYTTVVDELPYSYESCVHIDNCHLIANSNAVWWEFNNLAETSALSKQDLESLYKKIKEQGE